MRFGLVILPEYPWRGAAAMWRAAEELGFDHAWTYDHLVWGGLVGHPWHATMPTLTAAATVTSRIGLGTFVASPNFRHPYPFARDLITLDDVSDGRAIVGIGAGGEPDLTILGGEELTPRRRGDRLGEFVDLLDALLTRDHVDATGEWFTVRDARTAPGPTRSPRMPFVVAANGPRSMRIAARRGQGWVTTGRGGDDAATWWRRVADLVDRFEAALADAGRDPAGLDGTCPSTRLPATPSPRPTGSSTTSGAPPTSASPTSSPTGPAATATTRATSRCSRRSPPSCPPCVQARGGRS
ncbi:LLM class flavin-dependent oxidoreductase [Agilicoccus flavus]|uniref:LLM class flavin-dependent oxidoreductase n=1 Tax=Agilicoccus flavus TaxID=2775968 RepID=UPI0027D9F041|nr:LLM class flavin-dependent oxidoreductase [Agilicoccus flavus]